LKKQFTNSLFIILDLIFIGFFYFFIFQIRGNLDLSWLPNFNAGVLSNPSMFFIIIIATLLYEKIYFLRFDFWEETKLTLQALFLSFVIILSILMLGKISQDYSRLFLMMYFIGLMILLPIYKRVVKKIVFKIKFFRKKVKIVGNEDQINMLTDEFKQNWYFGFEVVKDNPDIIFVATKDVDMQTLDRYLKKYSLSIKDIYVLPYMKNINFAQSQIIELFNIKTTAIKIENNLLRNDNIYLKELFEKFLVVCSLPFFLIIHFILSFMIKKDSKGDSLFKQDRLGKDNKLFKCYKYRTMLENSEEVLKEYLEKNPEEVEHYEIYHKYKFDPRITKVGQVLRKLSLDELPQLINVLKGEMSLIGPRPYMPSESHKLKDSIEVILRVKPGISGLWQVSGRNNLSFKDRKNLDVWYIQNWSLWMDIVILMKTLKVVLLKTGAK